MLQAFHAAHIKAGQRVLIHGGNGGIGSVAVQMAKAWGCHVTATCSTKNLQFVRVIGKPPPFGGSVVLPADCTTWPATVYVMQGLGADEVLDYTKDTVDKVYINNPFDVVIDSVGGKHYLAIIAVVSDHGVELLLTVNSMLIPWHFEFIYCIWILCCCCGLCSSYALLQEAFGFIAYLSIKPKLAKGSMVPW